MLATDHAIEPSTAGAEQGRGRVARYAWGDDYHDLLRSRVNQLAAWLEARVPGCRTRGVVDSAPIAERDFAWAAGLGWFGKNTMLIDPSAGSYFFLTAFLTDVPLPADDPLPTDHCGTCTACLDACPTGALPEPGVLDATRCISALTVEQQGPIPADLRAGMGDWIFGCDVCQEVCPWNRHAPGSDEPGFQPRRGEAALPLAGLLALDDSAFRARFKGSPIKRAKRSGLLRSAAIALGNRPDPTAFAELAAAARLHDKLAERNAKALAISVDSVPDHHRWIQDIESTQGIAPNFPIIGDADRAISALYALIPPDAPDTFTVRSVYFVDPARKVRAIITYPASTGRNFDELLRVLDSLQLTDVHKVATPANWKDGDEVVIVPSLQDPAEIAARVPSGHRVVRPWLRFTRQPNK
jgi:epoxyqueuosine reductase